MGTIVSLLDKLGLLGWARRMVFERGVKVKTKKGINMYIVGSNKFINVPVFLVYDGKPLIQVEYENGRLFLTATILDQDNQIVARIFRNRITENKDKIFTIDRGRNKIVLVKREGIEYVEFIVHDSGALEINGTFYCDGRKVIEATPRGMKVFP